MAKVTGDIRKLNRRLFPLAQDVDKKLRAHKFATAMPGKIASSMFRKAVRTFQAIELLKPRRLIEESWILLRVLLETHVTILYFMRPPEGDISMTRRHADAAILQKLTHLREVDFYDNVGFPEQIKASREKWEQLEQQIKHRYTPQELKRIKKNGFSGKSFQERAAIVGMKTMYELCYRIASRSVHSFDPAETSLTHGVYPKGQATRMRNSLLKSRRLQLERNQNMLLGRLAYLFSKVIEDPILEFEVLILGVGYEKFCEGPDHGDPVADDPEEDDDAPGTFRVWRI